MELVIAVELGGTNLRVGAITPEGTILRAERFPWGPAERGPALIERIDGAIERTRDAVVQERHRVLGIALGVPGIVDPREGVVYNCPHIPDWKSVPLVSHFQERLGLPIRVDNDAHLVARGEAWKGAGRGAESFLLLTLGTGVGGAIFWEGDILAGDRGFGGEMGHLVVVAQGPPCACGGRGCLEMYVSSAGILYAIENPNHRDNALRDRFLERVGGIGRLTVQKVYEAARDGDIYANSVFKRMGYYLGVGIASLVNVTGIGTVILAGGVSNAWEFFIDATYRELRERTFPAIAKTVSLKRAELGDDAGLLGGATTFFQKHP